VVGHVVVGCNEKGRKEEGGMSIHNKACHYVRMKMTPHSRIKLTGKEGRK